MQTTSCSLAATEYINRKSRLARIGKVIVPLGGKLLFVNRFLMARRSLEPLVLCYHGVVSDKVAEDPHHYGNLVCVSDFSAQMTLLARTMHPISLLQFEEWIHRGAALPEHSVLITFDDGYRNNLIYAAPILTRLGIPAVIFPTVSCLGTDCLLWPTEVYRAVLHWHSPSVPLPDGSAIVVAPDDVQRRTALAEWVREFCKTLSEELKSSYLLLLREASLPALTPDEMEMFSFLSWEELAKLQRIGFAVGSHTLEHCILTRVPAERLRRELEESKEILEKQLGTQCVSLAYPNGRQADYSPHVLSYVAQAGYKLAFTTNPVTCTRSTDPLTLNRICIPGKVSRLAYESRISGLHDSFKRSFARMS